MIEQDTICLLRECDAGVKMGISSIDDVLESVKSKQLYTLLKTCKSEHEKLKKEIESALARFDDEGKEPNVMAKAMVSPTDASIADLMTDGCGMGVKSLGKYLNQYKAADESAKDVCKRLIQLEERLARDIRVYL